jgi:putative oxidoreductase
VSLLTGVMTNAIRHVHWQNGLWVTDGGIELPAVILAALAAVGDSGPGPYSVDEALGIGLRGPVVTGMAMAAGAVGAVYVASRGPELFAVRDADEELSRSVERSAAAS